MDDKVVWAGMLCIFASIVGGGFEALGVQHHGVKRKVDEGITGRARLYTSDCHPKAQLQLVLPPYGPQKVISDSVLLAPRRGRSFTLDVGRPGRVAAILTGYSPKWVGGTQHAGSPGLYVSICQSKGRKTVQRVPTRRRSASAATSHLRTGHDQIL